MDLPYNFEIIKKCKKAGAGEKEGNGKKPKYYSKRNFLKSPE